MIENYKLVNILPQSSDSLDVCAKITLNVNDKEMAIIQGKEELIRDRWRDE